MKFSIKKTDNEKDKWNLYIYAKLTKFKELKNIIIYCK